MDPSSDNHYYSTAEFKLASVTIHHKSDPLRFHRSSGQEEEKPEFQFEFRRRHFHRYFVNPSGSGFPYLERSLDCNSCRITTHSVKVDPYNSTDCSTSPLEKAVVNAFVELEVRPNSTNVRGNAIGRHVSTVVREAEMLAIDARNKGRKKMGMRVEIVIWSNYMYDEEARMQTAMLESAEEESFRFVPASRTALDNLEKMKLNVDVFGGCDGYSCQICLEDMKISTEITRMPCSHMFHSSCIEKWLGTSHVCPLCRFKLPV